MHRHAGLYACRALLPVKVGGGGPFTVYGLMWSGMMTRLACGHHTNLPGISEKGLGEGDTSVPDAADARELVDSVRERLRSPLTPAITSHREKPKTS